MCPSRCLPHSLASSGRPHSSRRHSCRFHLAFLSLHHCLPPHCILPLLIQPLSQIIASPSRSVVARITSLFSRRLL
ncbi:hypothetical protein HN873_012572, partial [Arachis hypogaea]